MTETDKLFEARIADCVRLGEKRPAFLGFLDLSEHADAEDILRRLHCSGHRFFGGFPEAERTLLGVFPEYIDPVDEEFPLSALTVRFRKQDTLKHSDFLGAFLAQGVVRSALGDILIEPGRAVLFVKAELVPHLVSVQKIGRVGVSVEEGFADPLPAAHSFQSVSGVIASARLDCFVAFLASVSREKASQMIASGFVSVNHRETLSGAKLLAEGDVISIRRVGRFVFDAFGQRTKKGRLSIQCRKYI